MCEKLEIPAEFLPEICSCDTIVGTVTEKAAQQCGLTAGIPVAAGGLDAACGTLGAGVIHPGETQETGWTGGRNEHLHRQLSGRSQTDPGLSCSTRTVSFCRAERPAAVE